MKSKLFFEILNKELTSRVESEKNAFKIRAFKNVINQLNSIDGFELEIETIDDIKHYNLNGIGKGIKTIMDDILSGKIKMKEQTMEEAGIALFTNIMSVGVVKAKKLVADKIYTIENLHNALKTNSKLLNEKQKLGLKYFDDFNMKIPRSEMMIHDQIIQNAISKIKHASYSIVGSYRRGLGFSGDIDVIVTSKVQSDDILSMLVDHLKKINYICDDFALGDKKYMGCCKVCEKYRRIDILYISSDKYPFALTYFTGSKEHNIKMRKQALKLGYSLNEFGLKKKGEYIQANIKTEKDLFDFLNLDYVEPNMRV